MDIPVIYLSKVSPSVTPNAKKCMKMLEHFTVFLSPHNTEPLCPILDLCMANSSLDMTKNQVYG